MALTRLLIVGAGPYGLALAAYAKRRGLDTAIVGEPMGFWKHGMPPGMLLRSDASWHLDAQDRDTFEAFLRARDVDPDGVLPISRELFLDYAVWFQERNQIDVVPSMVTELRRDGDAYRAQFDGHAAISARSVVVTPGLRPFATLPENVVRDLPAHRYDHSSTLVDFGGLRGKRCLIVGGRQSAFESAALILEAGADAIDIVYRHDTPAFAAADWELAEELARNTLAEPGWYRHLSANEQERIASRFWAEGRLKLEPWLPSRLAGDRVALHPNSIVARCVERPDGDIDVTLADGAELRVDHVLLATGYRPDLRRVSYLAPSLLAELRTADGFPRLDDAFQSSAPGLFFTGLVAARDFGPLFGFVRGAPVAARIIVDYLVVQDE